jgi:hypothetical protein
MTTPTPKSEVRVTLSLKTAKKIKEMVENFGAPKVYWEAYEKLAFSELGIAIRKAQPRPEPTDEEKQAMISQGREGKFCHGFHFMDRKTRKCTNCDFTEEHARYTERKTNGKKRIRLNIFSQ